MKLAPSLNLRYESPLNPQEIILGLEPLIEPEKLIRFNGFGRMHQGKPYEGFIENNSFKMRRLINYRNSFQAIVHGQISPYKTGSIVEIQMRMHPLSTAFLALWFGAVALISVFLLFTGAIPMVLIPVLMFVLIYAVSFFAFKHEAKKAQRDLQRVLHVKG